MFNFWISLENGQILLSCVDRYDKQPNNIIWTLLPKSNFLKRQISSRSYLVMSKWMQTDLKTSFSSSSSKNVFLVSYLRSFQYLALIRFISLRFDNSCLFSFCGKIILVGVLSLVALLRASFLWCDRTTQQNLRNYYLINRLFSHFHHYRINSSLYI